MLRESTIFSELLDQKYHQGLGDGEARAKLILVRKLLEKKLGMISKETANALSKLGSEQVDHLAENLFDFTSLEDLKAWLRGHNGQMQAA